MSSQKSSTPIATVAPQPQPQQNQYLRHGATVSGPVGNSHPSWFHGHLTKDTCFQVLLPHQIGTYLLRPSSDQLAEYTLSVRTCTGVMNMRVFRRKDDGYYYLDAPEAYKFYSPTIEGMVAFYKSSEKGIAPLDDLGNIGGTRFHLEHPLTMNPTEVRNAIQSVRNQKALNII